jgi:hypothetical protein
MRTAACLRVLRKERGEEESASGKAEVGGGEGSENKYREDSEYSRWVVWGLTAVDSE